MGEESFLPIGPKPSLLSASSAAICGNRSAPAGAQFRENLGPYRKSLEVAEFCHMGLPIGNSGRLLRRRPVWGLGKKGGWAGCRIFRRKILNPFSVLKLCSVTSSASSSKGAEFFYSAPLSVSRADLRNIHLKLCRKSRWECQHRKSGHFYRTLYCIGW